MLCAMTEVNLIQPNSILQVCHNKSEAKNLCNRRAGSGSEKDEQLWMWAGVYWVLQVSEASVRIDVKYLQKVLSCVPKMFFNTLHMFYSSFQIVELTQVRLDNVFL